MAAAFSGSPTRYDMLFVEQLATYQYSGGLAGILAACNALSPGKIYVMPGLISGSFGLVVFKSDLGFDIVSIAGTASPYQLVAELAASHLIPYDGVPGRVSAYFAIDLSLVISAIVNICGVDTPLVLMGHSLGGATAQLGAVYLTQHYGCAVQGVYTIGSPKPGDAVFAAQQSYPVYRLVNEGDVVPSIPANVPGLGLVAGFPAPASDWPLYVHTGTAITQTADAKWKSGETPMNAAQVVANIVSGNLYLHAVDSYMGGTIAGLPIKSKLQPFTDGFEKPWAFFKMTQHPPGPWTPPGPPIPVPAAFTNRIEAYLVNLKGDASLLGTVTSEPPHSWTPLLQPQPQRGANGCCK